MANPSPSSPSLFTDPPRARLPVPELIQRLDAIRSHGILTQQQIWTWSELTADAVYHLKRLTDPTPKVRRGSPETSHAAARRVARAQGEQHRQVLGALAVLGGNGTAREIATHSGAPYVRGTLAPLSTHAVGKRLCELVRAGYIERTAEERGNMGVYRLVRKAEG